MQYICGKYVVTLLHYGSKEVFVRDQAGEEFLVSRPFFDEKYQQLGGNK